MATQNSSLTQSRIRFGNHCRDVLEIVLGFAHRCMDRRRQRLDLDALDDAALKDIGLSPENVRRECAKPFWR
jgi:uncharacterized protein YjiS (DUF1127 family)